MSYFGFSSYSVGVQRPSVTNVEKIYKKTKRITKNTVITKNNVEKNTIVEESSVVQELKKRIEKLENIIESSETKYNSIGTE